MPSLLWCGFVHWRVLMLALRSVVFTAFWFSGGWVLYHIHPCVAFCLETYIADLVERMERITGYDNYVNADSLRAVETEVGCIVCATKTHGLLFDRTHAIARMLRKKLNFASPRQKS